MRPLAVCLLTLLVIAARALGQSAALDSNVYRDGRYVPLRLSADGPGTVTVFGSGIQPIEWAAPGRSSVVVPLYVYRKGGGVFVNGHETTIEPQGLDDTDIDPPGFAAFLKTIDPLPPARLKIDEDAYALAALWQPGQSAAVRQWILIATGVAVLMLAVARYAVPKHATGWSVVAALGLATLAIAFHPTAATRRVLPVDGRPAWEWVWYAGSAGRRVTEPWTPGLRYVPRTTADVMNQTPALACDAAGKPISISVDVPPGGRVVFIRPRVSPPASAE